MPQTASQFNPFMLMISPEVVLAAIEKSERLGQLNSRMCRPLDRHIGAAAEAQLEAQEEDDSSEDLLEADSELTL